MSQTEIIISGFGGQGALFAGHILAEAGMAEGKHVTWLPSYGPEMRGGTANVTVIIADEPIGSPIVQRPAAVIALNKPSATKYAPLVRAGGILLVNSSLVSEAPIADDIAVHMVPASQTAEELGSVKLANVVAMGALLAVTNVVGRDALEQALQHKLGDNKGDLVRLNRMALARGWSLVERTAPVASGDGRMA